MQQLSRKYAATAAFPATVTPPEIQDYPVKLIQFGEGNFLRGFVDWMVDRMNRKGLFNGSVKIIQPIERGMTDILNQQDGLYTLFLRGLKDGGVTEEKSVIASVKDGMNPYADYSAFLQEAENPDLRFLVSNTTEAGIAYTGFDGPQDTPPATFPGKVALFLHRRFTAFKGDPSKGLVMLPCELINRNGDNLKRIVLQLTDEWKLGTGFRTWLEESNIFCNTLVDRIITGYPFDTIEENTRELGYEDKILDTGEIFHLWVIEGPESLKEEFPLHKAGVDVVWTNDMTPYRTRKVRILNGAHTMTVLGAYLAGLETVGDCLKDKTVSAYIRKGLFEEVIPTMDMPKHELEAYAEETLERFANPFITHYLLSIALNSVSKFKARVLPTLKDSLAAKKTPPGVLTFSLAALISFYRGTDIKDGALVGSRGAGTYSIKDDEAILNFFKNLYRGLPEKPSDAECEKLATAVLESELLWAENLTLQAGLSKAVAEYLKDISSLGMRGAMEKLIRNRGTN